MPVKRVIIKHPKTVKGPKYEEIHVQDGLASITLVACGEAPPMVGGAANTITGQITIGGGGPVAGAVKSQPRRWSILFPNLAVNMGVDYKLEIKDASGDNDKGVATTTFRFI
jgi:hypothetical protein